MKLIIYSILVLILVISIMLFRGSIKKQSVTALMSEIESDTGLTFPANSRLEHYSEPGWVFEPEWIAKVVVPASSYESFKQALIVKPSDDTAYRNELAASADWWKPKNKVLWKQYMHGSNTIVRIIVSEDDNGFSVYINCVVF